MLRRSEDLANIAAPAVRRGEDEGADGEAADEGGDQGETASTKETGKPEKIKAVKILKSAALGDLPLFKEIDLTIKVKGGSGEYTGKMTGLPEGITYEYDGEDAFKLSGAPAKLGSSDATLTVADANDESNGAAKTFQMRVVEEIAIKAYRSAGQDGEWEEVSGKIDIPFGTKLKFEVDSLDTEGSGDGHGDGYTWSIGGTEVHDGDAVQIVGVTVPPRPSLPRPSSTRHT